MKSILRIEYIVISLLLCSNAAADILEIDASHVGGFYGDGTYDNSLTFQNYFIGYGTSPGSPRTAERRSFFVFDLSTVTDEITAASFSLRLKPFGLIFGKDCLGADPCTDPLPFADDLATPWDDTDPGEWPTDMFEEFVVGATPVPSALIADPALPPDDPGPGLGAIEIFETLATTPIADPFFITPSDPFDFTEGSAEIVITLNETGLTLLNGALGGEFVLTTFMPSWSFEDRTTPLGDDLVEKSELIFGLTDLVTGGVTTDLPSPFLEITTSPVPVPPLLWLFGLSLFTLVAHRRKSS